MLSFLKERSSAVLPITLYTSFDAAAANAKNSHDVRLLAMTIAIELTGVHPKGRNIIGGMDEDRGYPKKVGPLFVHVLDRDIIRELRWSFRQDG